MALQRCSVRDNLPKKKKKKRERFAFLRPGQIPNQSPKLHVFSGKRRDLLKKKHVSGVEIKTQNGWKLLDKPCISVYNNVIDSVKKRIKDTFY